MGKQEQVDQSKLGQNQTVDITDAFFDAVFGTNASQSQAPTPSSQKKYVLKELQSDEVKAELKLSSDDRVYVFYTKDEYTKKKATEFANLLKSNSVKKGRIPFKDNLPALTTSSGEVICAQAEHIKVGFANYNGKKIFVLYNFKEQAPSSDVLDTPSSTAETVSLSAGDTAISSSPSDHSASKSTGKIPDEVRRKLAEKERSKDSREAAAKILDEMRRRR